MKKYFCPSVVSLLLLLSGCSGDDVSGSKLSAAPSPSVSEHFSFVIYDGLSEAVSGPILTRLEENYSRVLADLNLTSLNRVTVKIWNDETHFLNDMQSDIGAKFYGALGYVYSPTEVRVLYRGNTPQAVLHEFCHAASMAVNSRIGNNPRWLWEAVAIYESGEFKDPKTINYLVSGNFPTISELNSDFNTGSNKIYDVGYTISEYIISIAGKTAFVDLIRSNGNIQQTLGISVQQFETGWTEFVRTKYLK